jgi:hypothetical protein
MCGSNVAQFLCLICLYAVLLVMRFAYARYWTIAAT